MVEPSDADPERTSGLGEALLDPAIARIEDRFLIDGKRFSELDLDRLSLEAADSALRQVLDYQVEEKRRLFETRSLQSMTVVSGEEFYARQYWLFPELMLLPVRRDGVLTDEYAVLTQSDSSAIYGLREMLREIRSRGECHERDRATLDAFLERVLQAHPDATVSWSPDRSEVYVFDRAGVPIAGHVLATVGN